MVGPMRPQCRVYISVGICQRLPPAPRPAPPPSLSVLCLPVARRLSNQIIYNFRPAPVTTYLPMLGQLVSLTSPNEPSASASAACRTFAAPRPRVAARHHAEDKGAARWTSLEVRDVDAAAGARGSIDAADGDGLTRQSSHSQKRRIFHIYRWTLPIAASVRYVDAQ